MRLDYKFGAMGLDYKFGAMGLDYKFGAMNSHLHRVSGSAQ